MGEEKSETRAEARSEARSEAAKLHKMAGTPARITLGGTEYVLSPLTVDDLAEMERWIEDLPLQHARRVLATHGDMFSEEQKDRVLMAAVEEGKTISLSTGAPALESMEGVRILLWLSLRHEHPEVKCEDVFKLLAISDLDAIKTTLDEVSGMKEVSAGES